MAIQTDRYKAIQGALSEGQKGDTILIAGKGHEKRQIFRHHTNEFDDVAVAREILSQLELAEVGSS